MLKVILNYQQLTEPKHVSVIEGFLSFSMESHVAYERRIVQLIQTEVEIEALAALECFQLVEPNEELGFDAINGSFLHMLARYGCTKALKAFYERTDWLEVAYRSAWGLAHIAAYHGHRDVLALLAEAGIDLDCAAETDPRPIDLAALNGHLSCVTFLLGQGALNSDFADMRSSVVTLYTNSKYSTLIKSMKSDYSSHSNRWDNHSIPIALAALQSHTACVAELMRHVDELNIDTHHISSNRIMWAPALQCILKCLESSLMVGSLSLCIDIDEEVADQLAMVLRCNESISRLKLSGTINLQAALILKEAISENTTLTSIEIGGFAPQSDEDNDFQDAMDELLSTFVDRPILTSLRVTGEEGAIHENEMNALMNGLRANARMSALRLVGPRLRELDLHRLANSLLKYSFIKVISLPGSSLTDLGAGAIAALIRQNAHIDTLDLSSPAQITEQGMLAIAGALGENQGLTSLDLSHMGASLANDGVKMLGDSLVKNQTLTTLDLSCNIIDDDDVAVLMQRLELNRSLTTLDLSQGIDFSERWVMPIADYLAKNKSIQRLNLSGDQIDASGAMAIALALKVNKRLIALDLSDNSIGDHGVEAIADALKHNHVLREINLTSCSLTRRAIKKLAEAMTYNRSLTSIAITTTDAKEAKIDAVASEFVKALKLNHTLMMMDWFAYGPRGESGDRFSSSTVRSIIADALFFQRKKRQLLIKLAALHEDLESVNLERVNQVAQMINGLTDAGHEATVFYDQYYLLLMRCYLGRSVEQAFHEGLAKIAVGPVKWTAWVEFLRCYHEKELQTILPGLSSLDKCQYSLWCMRSGAELTDEAYLLRLLKQYGLRATTLSYTQVDCHTLPADGIISFEELKQIAAYALYAVEDASLLDAIKHAPFSQQATRLILQIPKVRGYLKEHSRCQSADLIIWEEILYDLASLPIQRQVLTEGFSNTRWIELIGAIAGSEKTEAAIGLERVVAKFAAFFEVPVGSRRKRQRPDDAEVLESNAMEIALFRR